MNKLKRKDRIGAIVQILVSSPNEIFTLTYFNKMFESSKSTISEDLVIIKETFELQKLGRIETITGAAGGVKYIPIISKEKKKKIINDLVQELSKPERRMTGGFIYLNDILYDPRYVRLLGAIFTEKFIDKNIDYIVTVETKGIPLALMTANSLNIPLVVFRNSFKAEDGPTLSIHYQSGSNGRLKKMYAPKNSIKKESNVLIVDGFMKAGGTTQGMITLVEELESTVVGIGIVFEEKTVNDKLVNDYFSIFNIDLEKELEPIKIQSEVLK